MGSGAVCVVLSRNCRRFKFC